MNAALDKQQSLKLNLNVLQRHESNSELPVLLTPTRATSRSNLDTARTFSPHPLLSSISSRSLTTERRLSIPRVTIDDKTANDKKNAGMGEESDSDSDSSADESKAEKFSSVESIMKRAQFFDQNLILEMEQINLSFSALSDAPADIGLFTRLRILTLSHNKIRVFSAMRLVQSCPMLEKIDLSYNRINNIRQFRDLGHLQHLEEIDFRKNPIPILENRIAIIQALLFFHPFRPFFPPPEKRSTPVDEHRDKDRESPDRIKARSPPPGPVKFKKKTKKLQLKRPEASVLLRIESVDNNTEEKAELKRHPSVPKLLLRRKQAKSMYDVLSDTPLLDSDVTVISTPLTPTHRLHTSNSTSLIETQKGVVPRFMNPTASSLRHMNITPQDKDEQTPSTLDTSSLAPQTGTEDRSTESPRTRSSGIQKLRKAKTLINVFAAFKRRQASSASASGSHEGDKKKAKPVTPYLAYAEQQERMAKFMNDFKMSDMTPFLESISKLHQIYNDPKIAIEQTKMCPVPRSYYTPFPMLKIVNGCLLNVGEYMLAENEEIFDICAHNNKKLGKKFFLDSSMNNLRMKYKMQSGNENVQDKQLQKLRIEEADDSDIETPDTDGAFSDNDFDEDYLVKKNRQKIKSQREQQFDAGYLLEAIIKSQDKPPPVINEFTQFGYVVETAEHYKTLNVSPGKWNAIQNRLPEPVTLNFGESIRRGFNKSRKISDGILGIERKKKIEFRPFKSQIIDMTYDEVVMKMKRAELKQNVEHWTDHVNYLKNVELDTPKEDDNGAPATPSVYRTSTKRSSSFIDKKWDPVKSSRDEETYLENDEVSKFFHDQEILYQMHQKQMEKTEQLRQKSALKQLSNKGIRRQLAASGMVLGKMEEDEDYSIDQQVIKFEKMFV